MAGRATRKSLGVIGVGNMGGALLRGVAGSRVRKPSDVIAYDVDRARLADACAAAGVAAAKSMAGVCAARTVLLAVKPQVMSEVLAEVAPALHRPVRVISIAAGVRCGTIEEALGGRVPVLRVMPNTPALVGEGAAALCGGRWASPSDLRIAAKLLAAVGKVFVVDEGMMDAVTALSGSGPAYFFLLMEAMAAAGVELGLPADVAAALAVQTALGAGRLAAESPDGPAELRRRVTSPGGTTEAALRVFAEGGFERLVSAAMKAARDRSVELSGGRPPDGEA